MVSGSSPQDAAAAECQDEALRETAALWYDRLNRDTVADEMHAAFVRWRDARPEHRQAYEAAAGAWALVRQGSYHPQIMALRHETALRLTRRSSRWSSVSLRVAAAAALVAIAVALTVTLQLPGVSWLSASGADGRNLYSTATGQRLTVTLPDSSQVTLNTQTRIRTVFTAGERRVLLEQGQALFEVQKDASRPFVVEARGRRFIAVGTAFDVRVDGHQVRLTMVEGTVSLAPLSPANNEDVARSPAILLSAGQQLTIDARASVAVEPLIRTADAERATSWRRGQVIFENTSLADAVAELNRYSEKKIELSGPELPELKLSGAFATGRIGVFVEALTTYFPVEVVHADDRVIILDISRHQSGEEQAFGF